jgi:hypothetical protein
MILSKQNQKIALKREYNKDINYYIIIINKAREPKKKRGAKQHTTKQKFTRTGNLFGQPTQPNSVNLNGQPTQLNPTQTLFPSLATQKMQKTRNINSKFSIFQEPHFVYHSREQKVSIFKSKNTP